mmetsp:Transcript_12836/g.11366  ORF Transcript_12836/g.11366 Transcript_12836/m.11366 type:complete len:199 (-) Transcript_12836:87-683(-)
MEYTFVDAFYNYANHSNPIIYGLNTGNQLYYSSSQNSFVSGKMQRSVVSDIDGRLTNFWNFRTIRDLQFHPQLYYGYIMIFEFHIQSDYYLYKQYYSFDKPTISRRLSESEVNTVEKVEEEDLNNNILFRFFYILSQLGGLYSTLSLILGLILQPIIANMFRTEAIKLLNEEEKTSLSISSSSSLSSENLSQNKLNEF